MSDNTNDGNKVDALEAEMVNLKFEKSVSRSPKDHSFSTLPGNQNLMYDDSSDVAIRRSVSTILNRIKSSSAFSVNDNKIYIEGIDDEKLKELARSHDINGDGIISIDEFRSMLLDQAANKKSAKSWRRLFFVSLVLLSMTIATLSGILWAIVDKSKDTSVTNSNTMTNRRNGNTVNTANTDYCTSTDGRLITRSADGSCPTENGSVVKVETAMSKAIISSSLSNIFFQNLVSFDITGPAGIYISLQTDGFTRNSDESVELLTSIGDIFVTGEDVSFSKETGDFLLRMGLDVVTDDIDYDHRVIDGSSKFEVFSRSNTGLPPSTAHSRSPATPRTHRPSQAPTDTFLPTEYPTDSSSLPTEVPTDSSSLPTSTTVPTDSASPTENPTFAPTV